VKWCMGFCRRSHRCWRLSRVGWAGGSCAWGFVRLRRDRPVADPDPPRRRKMVHWVLPALAPRLVARGSAWARRFVLVQGVLSLGRETVPLPVRNRGARPKWCLGSCQRNTVPLLIGSRDICRKWCMGSCRCAHHSRRLATRGQTGCPGARGRSGVFPRTDWLAALARAEIMPGEPMAFPACGWRRVSHSAASGPRQSQQEFSADAGRCARSTQMGHGRSHRRGSPGAVVRFVPCRTVPDSSPSACFACICLHLR
jgi:hypothetical protein